jgi:hypothetical protein
MMKNIALLSTVALLSLAAFTTGCKNDDDSSTDDGANLGTDEAQLVADDSESADTDDNMENGVDAPLSGAEPSDPGTPADGASDEELLEKVRANAGKHFIGNCLESTRDANKIHHVFKACRAPWSLNTFEGTVDSTYVREGNKLTIPHVFNGFLANGASLSGTRVVTYTREPSTSPTGGHIITKTRTGNFTGSTKKGKDISHTANFTASYDSGAKCITREGSAQTTIANRSFERVLTDYKRCGIGALGCPDAGGKLTLSKTNSEKGKSVSLTIEFLGDTKMRVTLPSGKQVDRTLVCNENAS